MRQIVFTSAVVAYQVQGMGYDIESNVGKNILARDKSPLLKPVPGVLSWASIVGPGFGFEADYSQRPSSIAVALFFAPSSRWFGIVPFVFGY